MGVKMSADRYSVMRFLSADKDWIWIGALLAMGLFHVAGKIQASFESTVAKSHEAIEVKVEKSKVAVK